MPRPSWGLYDNGPGPARQGHSEVSREQRKAEKAAAKAARRERATLRTAGMAVVTGARAEGDLAIAGVDATHCESRGELLHGRGNQHISFGVTQMQQSEQGTARQQGDPGNRSVAYAGQSAAAGRANGVARFVGLLMDGVRRNRARVVSEQLTQGFEVQWEQSVCAALVDLEQEFAITDMSVQYDSLCRFGRELMLRELQGKAVRILAHKKRKAKGKATRVKTSR